MLVIQTPPSPIPPISVPLSICLSVTQTPYLPALPAAHSVSQPNIYSYYTLKPGQLYGSITNLGLAPRSLAHISHFIPSRFGYEGLAYRVNMVSTLLLVNWTICSVRTESVLDDDFRRW